MNQSNSVSTAATPSRQASWREGGVLMLGSSLTIMGAVMVTPILPRLGAEFGPWNRAPICWCRWRSPAPPWR